METKDKTCFSYKKNMYKSIASARKLHIDTVTRKKPDKPRQREFFDVEVIDPRIVDGVLERKVRYVGYGKKYNEWLPAIEAVRASRDDTTKILAGC